MNNPLKSQIAANRERFDEQFPWQNCCDSCVQDKNEGYADDIDGCCCCHMSFIKSGNKIPTWLYEDLKKNHTTSQTSLLQTAIAAVEGLKIKVSSEDELVKRDGYRDPELQDYEIDVAKSYNEALSKVVELLKGGIDN